MASDKHSETTLDAKIALMERRLAAAKKIREIAAEFPDLIEEMADTPRIETAAATGQLKRHRIVGRRASNYKLIRQFFKRHNNQWFQAPQIGKELELSRGTIATVLWTTHSKCFEKKSVAGYKKRKVWRMMPDALNDRVTIDTESANGKDAE